MACQGTNELQVDQVASCGCGNSHILIIWRPEGQVQRKGLFEMKFHTTGPDSLEATQESTAELQY